MEGFEYYNPTKIVFGKGKIAALKDLVPKDAKVMMTYGGGSIKKNGVYDQVKAACKVDIEFGGIEANPDFETCMKAVKICREEKVDFILAVGGGSVIDGTKFIAAAVHYNKTDNEWDIVDKLGFSGNPAYIADKLVPFGTVLTLPATGSEMNNGSVISYRKIKRKKPFIIPTNFPIFSILDPEATFSLPEKQVSNGVIDSFSHTIEQYLSHFDESTIVDYFAESILKTLVEYGEKTLKNREDYRARAEFMFSSTLALNGLMNVPSKPCWATHFIGHELTALYGLDHGLTLAIIHPHVMRHHLGDEKFQKKYKRYAVNVFGCNPKKVKPEDAITKTEEFFKSLGKNLSIKANAPDAKEEDFEIVVKNIAAAFGPAIGGRGIIDADAIRKILKAAL